MNRVRNTAQSERTLATDFGCCRPARSKLLKAPLWGLRASRLSNVKDYQCNGSRDCRWRPEPVHLGRQSMSPECTSGHANVSIHMETQNAPQIHVGREEIRVLVIHLQLSPSPQPGYDLQRRKNSRPGQLTLTWHGSITRGTFITFDFHLHR